MVLALNAIFKSHVIKIYCTSIIYISLSTNTDNLVQLNPGGDDEPDSPIPTNEHSCSFTLNNNLTQTAVNAVTN